MDENRVQRGSYGTFKKTDWLMDRSLLFTFHWPIHQHDLNLTAKEAGKGNLSLCQVRGNGTAEHIARLARTLTNF